MKFSEGNYDAMNPQYSGSMGTPRWSNFYLGTSTWPQTAAQLQQIGTLASSGMRNIEIAPIQPQVWESIPRQHFEEMRRLSKLAGVKPSVHAPIFEPSGFGDKGWSEQKRQEAERRFMEVVDRAHEMDPDGNIPINLHGSQMQGTTWEKGLTDDKGEETPRSMLVVDPSIGSGEVLNFEERTQPGGGTSVMTVKESLDSANANRWEAEKRQLTDMHKEINSAQEQVQKIQIMKHGLEQASSLTQEQQKQLDSLRAQEAEVVNRWNLYYNHLAKTAHTMFDKLNKAAEYAGQDELKEKITEFNQQVKQIDEHTSGGRQMMISAVDHFINSPDLPSPKYFIPAEKFVEGQSSETVANMALHGYNKYGETAPTICVENFFPGSAIGDAQTLQNTVLTARDKAARKLMEQGISSSEAHRVAEKLIGATWDVGHINLIKKQGYDDEKIKEETAKIAGEIKHVHLTDNFGGEDSHLAPGMGNVPINAVTEELAKAGKMGKVRGILESTGFVQQFKASPVLPALEYFNSPMYAWKASPTWQDTGGYFFGSSGYSAGYGSILPDQHFSMYGGGFSQLPNVLGAQMGGERSKFAGAPMS